jgi:hypothetical protein
VNLLTLAKVIFNPRVLFWVNQFFRANPVVYDHFSKIARPCDHNAASKYAPLQLEVYHGIDVERGIKYRFRRGSLKSGYQIRGGQQTANHSTYRWEVVTTTGCGLATSQG